MVNLEIISRTRKTADQVGYIIALFLMTDVQVEKATTHPAIGVRHLALIRVQANLILFILIGSIKN